MMMYPPTEQCKTCPFRGDGLRLRPHYIQQIWERLLEGENHLCHSAREEKRVCWGGRQWQLEVFHRLGHIASPTNEALAAAMQNSGVEPKGHIFEAAASGTSRAILKVVLNCSDLQY